MFVVVTDREGFVGAFKSLADAQAALRLYVGVPFIYTEWAHCAADTAADAATDTAADAAADTATDTATDTAADAAADTAADTATDLIWILPYKGCSAVAYASNNKDAVSVVQQDLLRLDLVHPDDVMYWECVMGEIVSPAKQRLADVLAALGAVDSTAAPVPDKDIREKEDGDTIDRFLELASRGDEEEPARINLLESVVPRALPDPRGGIISPHKLV